MPASRETARELALIGIYIWQMGAMSLQELQNWDWYQSFYDFDAEEVLPPVPASDAEAVYRFANTLLVGVVSQLERLDTVICKLLVDWSFDRLHALDKATLRLGAYELIYALETPAEVVIDQANQLATQFSETESYRYLNGILHQMKLLYRDSDPSSKLNTRSRVRLRKKGGSHAEL